MFKNEEVSVMKFSFVKNDTTTIKDELCLGMIILVALTIGVLLVVFRRIFGLFRKTAVHALVFWH